MSRHDEREITRRLADTPAGEPPPELLARLREDIPDDLTAGLAADDEATQAQAPAPAATAPTPFSRRWLATAATLLMVVAGGFFAWKLSQEVGPLGRSAVDGPPAAERTAETVETPEAKPATAPTADTAGTVAEGQAARDDVARDEAEQHRAASAGDATPVRQAFEDSSAQELAAQEPAPPQPAPEEAAAASPTATSPTAAPSTPPATSAASPRARAQTTRTTTPSLRIQVVDNSDRELPGTTVRVEGQGQAREKFADMDGRVEFDNLPSGTYEVEGELEGFDRSYYRVPVAGDEEVTERKVILSSVIAEEIVVVSDAPAMDFTPSGAAANPSPAPQASRLAPPSPPPAPRQRRQRRHAAALRAQPASPQLEEMEDRAAGATSELEMVVEPVEGEPAADQRGDVPEPEAKAASKDESQAQSSAQRFRETPIDPAPEPPVPTNPVIDTSADRLSTFGLDVDTGSFTLLRAHLEAGRMPPPAAVRVEEVVNAQPFSDPFAAAPARPGETFRVTADGTPSPFAPTSPAAGAGHRLLRFRVSARELSAAQRKPVVLTLVVDVSGSMAGEGLDLVRAGVGRLLESLRPEDRVALVVFSNNARLVTPHGEPAALAVAAAALATEGGTNAEAGLTLGYDTARRAFDPAAVNRVVLLSDGVANVGATGPEAILKRIAAAAADGIELTTVGVGMDFNDRMMETLADRGDGRYAYADDRREMERLFAEELDGTLQTVAEEARAQVEFDPRVVESWRQVGYENRAIADHEFRYDSVDAGEIGPGHSVTALYEVKLRAEPAPGRPLALVKLRWREPAAVDGGGDVTAGRFREIEERLTAEDLAPRWSAADPDLRLAAVAAELAEHLRRSPHATSAPSTLLTEARRLAASGVPGAAELVELAEAWRRLDGPAADAEEPGAD